MRPGTRAAAKSLERVGVNAFHLADSYSSGNA